MTRLLFRLHPVIYWIAGLLMIALAAIVYLSMLEDNARRAEALAGDPPAAVRLEDFDKAVHANAAKEVVILATVETAAMYTMSRETFGVEIKRWVAPLRPAASGLDATEIRAALFERDGAAPAETLSRWFVAENEGRPVARLHGVLKTVSGGRRQQIEEAFAEHGLTLAEDAIFIDPFQKPRRRELAPEDAKGVSAIIAGAGGVLILYGFLRRWMRRRRRVVEA